MLSHNVRYKFTSYACALLAAPIGGNCLSLTQTQPETSIKATLDVCADKGKVVASLYAPVEFTGDVVVLGPKTKAAVFSISYDGKATLCYVNAADLQTWSDNIWSSWYLTKEIPKKQRVVSSVRQIKAAKDVIFGGDDGMGPSKKKFRLPEENKKPSQTFEVRSLAWLNQIQFT